MFSPNPKRSKRLQKSWPGFDLRLQIVPNAALVVQIATLRRKASFVN
jgi:hypothetical protein